ncbi:hypothetical protein [Amycolatopsis alba]|uniref:Uncharacterized protein n=1 Tax=Amycolatopsis alba DSM 44262 TaxID=1125972 RepID=A0A229R888_AMYAL|nr:hypothetical protein [Amycolatopsis alba]OXM42880.1 hypothetical protein CFP75_40870 [Amycolatopsis alba DSM 44262]
MELAVIVGQAMLLGGGATWLVSSRWHQRRQAELVRSTEAAWEYARYLEYVAAHRRPPRPGPPFLG